MKPPRFSLVQLVLVTALVGILLAGYRAVREQKQFLTRGSMQFFPEGQKLLFHSLSDDRLEIWDFSGGSLRVRRLSLGRLAGLPASQDTSSMQALPGDRICIDTADEWLLIDCKAEKVLRRWQLGGKFLLATSSNGEFYVCNPSSVVADADLLEVVRTRDNKAVGQAILPTPHAHRTLSFRAPRPTKRSALCLPQLQLDKD